MTVLAGPYLVRGPYCCVLARIRHTVALVLTQSHSMLIFGCFFIIQSAFGFGSSAIASLAIFAIRMIWMSVAILLKPGICMFAVAATVFA